MVAYLREHTVGQRQHPRLLEMDWEEPLKTWAEFYSHRVHPSHPHGLQLPLTPP